MQCGFCSKDAPHNCSRCCKISYCSKVCQTSHWKIHKVECFPLAVVFSPDLGRYLVATKDIKQWEVILKEKPLVSSPTDTINEPICLGCNKILKQSYNKCTSCKWPICSSECQKMTHHAEFECLIFSQASVEFSDVFTPYRQIHVLRCLLMKEKCPQKWKDILLLQSHMETKLKTPMGMMNSMMCAKFINVQCRLTQFTRREIDHALGVIATNSFGGENYDLDEPRSASHLYKVASMAAHDCVPNCYRLINQDSTFELRASFAISAGSAVTTFYIDTWIPTQERYSALKMNYSFSCSCKRCQDPSELGTYFSAVKCSEINIKNCKGYLTPVIPSDENTKWRCTLCSRKTNGDLIQELNSKFEQAVMAIPEENTMENLQMSEDIVKSYQNRVHPNHYKLVDLEYDIAERIHNFLASDAFAGKIILQKKMLNRLLAICQHQLDVADIIRPGFSIYRGKVLYIMQYGLMVKLLQFRETKKNGNYLPREIAKIEEIRATALKILSVEPAIDIVAMVENLENPFEMLECKAALLNL